MSEFSKNVTDKPDPIPPFPEYDDRENWRPIYTDFTWNADVNRVVENGIDIAHTSFVVQVRNVFKWGMFDKGSVKRTLRGRRYRRGTVATLPSANTGGRGLRGTGKVYKRLAQGASHAYRGEGLED